METASESTNPFLSEERVDRLADSLESSLSELNCFLDSSVALGYPLHYLTNVPLKRWDMFQLELFSRFYERFNPLFAEQSIQITPRVKHALIRLIFHGRIKLVSDGSAGAMRLDRQFDLLHRASCHKRSYAPRELRFGMPAELDDEILSAVFESASEIKDIIGLATRNTAQINKIVEVAAERKSLPIELVTQTYDCSAREYRRKSLYRMKDVLA